MTVRRGPPPRDHRGPRSRRFSPTALVWIAATALFVVVGGLLAFGYYIDSYLPPRRTALEVGDRDFKMSYLADRMRYLVLDTAIQGFPPPTSDAPRLTVERLEREELLRQFGPDDGLTATEAEIDEALRAKVALLTGRGQGNVPEGSEAPAAPEAETPGGSATATPPPDGTPTGDATAGATATAPPGDSTATPLESVSPSPTATATATVAPFASDDEFEDALDELKDRTGLSEDELREIVRAEVILRKLEERLRTEVAEALPQVQILSIIVPTREEAEEVVTRVDAGENFEEIQRSLNPDSAPTPATPPEGPRDDIPWVTRDMLLDAFADAVFETPVGGRTEIIASDRGFAIIQVVAKEDNRPLDEEQVRFYVAGLADDWFEMQSERVEIRRHLDADRIEWAIEEVFG